MFQILQEKDYDCVATRRANRKGEAKIRSFLSDTFYKVVNKISDTEIVSGARDYRLMNRTMVDAILELSEKNRFTNNSCTVRTLDQSGWSTGARVFRVVGVKIN